MVNLICDESITTPSDMTTVTFDEANCTFNTEVKGADACSKLSINALWEFFEQYDYLWGAIFIVIGVFFTFLGRKLFMAAVFIASLVLVTIVLLALCYGTFLSENNEYWVFWVMLSLSILIGILVGVLLVKYNKFAAAAVGAWGGYVLGLFINDLALWAIGSSWVFWLVNVGCAIVCAVLAFIFFNPAIIFGTALIGSYLLMRGIGEYAGGF